jgi:hypothetical protein
VSAAGACAQAEQGRQPAGSNWSSMRRCISLAADTDMMFRSNTKHSTRCCWRLRPGPAGVTACRHNVCSNVMQCVSSSRQHT